METENIRNIGNEAGFYEPSAFFKRLVANEYMVHLYSFHVGGGSVMFMSSSLKKSS